MLGVWASTTKRLEFKHTNESLTIITTNGILTWDKSTKTKDNRTQWMLMSITNKRGLPCKGYFHESSVLVGVRKGPCELWSSFSFCFPLRCKTLFSLPNIRTWWPCQTQGVMRATPEARGDHRGEPPSQQGCCGVQGDSSPGRLKSSMPFTVFSLWRRCCDK